MGCRLEGESDKSYWGPPQVRGQREARVTEKNDLVIFLFLWRFVQFNTRCEQCCETLGCEMFPWSEYFLGGKSNARGQQKIVKQWVSRARYKGSSDGRGGGVRGKKRPAELIMGEIIGEASIQIPFQSGVYRGFQDEDFQELQHLCHFQELLPSSTWGT